MNTPVHSVCLQAIRFALLTLLIFGLGYTLLGVGIGQFLLPKQAQGSLILKAGIPVGSTLVAQPFTSKTYFHSRPSASGHEATSASGSNLAQSNPQLKAMLQARLEQARQIESDLPVPSDFLTQSGSGIDPHISLDNAELQAQRVAQARGMSPQALQKLIERHTQGQQFGLFGQERVNVLQLNLALDELTTAQANK